MHLEGAVLKASHNPRQYWNPLKKTPRVLALALTSIAVLAGCSSPAAEPKVDYDAIKSKMAEDYVDRTEAFKAANASAAWLGSVESAMETEPGRLQINTTVVDPRGPDGSEPALVALSVCNAAVASFGATYPHIKVMEADGTHFVLFGHPAVPEGVCTEV